MAYELARAYVQIIPSMRGAGKTIQAELNGADISSRVSKSGTSMGAKLTTAMQKTMKRGLVVGAAATGGLMATALTKGFGRLRAFEQAEKSMAGMGLSAQQVSVVMGNANAAVEGTAFGLDAAATAAKSLVTAGVAPGEKLQRVLGLIGDTAAQAGTDFNTMGLIWNKVFAKGKLQGDEAMQLMEAGIPVYQLVAEQLGITAEEAMALGQKGQISAEIFADAMESQFKGSALSMGDTVTGSFQNVLAALGRLGQGVLGGPFADLPALFTTVRDKINAITPAVTAMSTEVYTRVRGVALALAKGNVRPIEEAFGLDRASSSRVASTLARLQAQVTLTGAAFRRAGTDIAASFSWVRHGSSLEGLMGVFDRLAVLGGTVARGFAQVAATAAPMVSYAAQAATILGGGLLASAERLVPAAVNLAEAIAKTGVSFTSALIPAANIASAIMVPLSSVVGTLADWLAKLPTPVLAVGAAFMMLRPHVMDGKKAVELFQRQLDTLQLRRHLAHMEGLSGSAILVQGAMRRATGAVRGMGVALKGLLVANAPLLALSAVAAVLGKISEASQRNKQELRDLADSFDDLGNATDQTREKLVEMMRADERAFGFGKNLEDRLNDLGISTKETVDAIQAGGPALDDLKAKLVALADAEEKKRVAGDLSGAQSKANKQHILDLIDALDKQANEYEQTAQKAKEAALASGDVARAQKIEADAIQEVINASKRRQDQLLGVRNKALAAREAERGLNEAIADSGQVVADASASLDSKNAALDRVAQATQRATVAAAENGATQEEINAIIERGRQAFFELGEQALGSTDEVAALWAQIGLLPDEVETRVGIDAAQAWVTLDGVKVGIDETTGLVTIDGNPVPANTKLAEVEGAINNGDGTVTIFGERHPADQTLDQLLADIAGSEESVQIDGAREKANTALRLALEAIRNGHEYVQIDGQSRKAIDVLNTVKGQIRTSKEDVRIGGAIAGDFYNTVGGAVAYIARQKAYVQIGAAGGAGLAALRQADGGLVKFFANGSERHIAQIARPGEWRVWAEPETGGEAYIPLAVSKRKRSLEILAEVAKRFGYGLTQFAGGGVAGPAPVSPAAGVNGARLVLEVEGREFPAYLREIADGRVAAHPGVRAAGDLVLNGARFRAQMGV
ncbi:hypothetical protein HMPREF3167_07260 [Trueperella sp. HMSC08B05]|uniref:tape measure protein n=1 Tax=Trueperella sp. HMSC08B05 TaxID=1581135 RepID=UPI0008A625B2|nr:tape measure protein [Trueperella sp. HMSC08B05]OFS72787.1 hypothetical protein HMPREF3167_07260 [Trueperella sp. HMSC08B05]